MAQERSGIAAGLNKGHVCSSLFFPFRRVGRVGRVSWFKLWSSACDAVGHRRLNYAKESSGKGETAIDQLNRLDRRDMNAEVGE